MEDLEESLKSWETFEKSQNIEKNPNLQKFIPVEFWILVNSRKVNFRNFTFFPTPKSICLWKFVKVPSLEIVSEGIPSGCSESSLWSVSSAAGGTTGGVWGCSGWLCGANWKSLKVYESSTDYRKENILVQNIEEEHQHILELQVQGNHFWNINKKEFAEYICYEIDYVVLLRSAFLAKLFKWPNGYSSKLWLRCKVSRLYCPQTVNFASHEEEILCAVYSLMCQASISCAQFFCNIDFLRRRAILLNEKRNISLCWLNWYMIQVHAHTTPNKWLLFWKNFL